MSLKLGIVGHGFVGSAVANGFDIDTELASFFSILNKRMKSSQVLINYNRRTTKEGKKLKVSDGWIILLRIIKMFRYF